MKKKKMLGTSDPWLTSCLSHRPSEPAYYMVDCQISKYHSSTLIFYIEGGHRKTTSMRKKTLVKKLLPIFNSLRTTHTTCCFIFSIAFYIHGWRLNALILVRNPIKHIFLPLKPCLSTKYIFQAVCTLYTKGSKSLNFEYNVPLILQKIP